MSRASDAKASIRFRLLEPGLIDFLDACGTGLRFFDARGRNRVGWARGTKFRRSFAGGNAELALRLLDLDVAESDGEGIGGVGRFGDARHREKGANHDLHLSLVGVAVACDGSFDFARGVAVDGKVVLGGGEKDDTADLGEAESGADVECAKDGFNGDNRGGKFGNQRAEALVNVLQASGGGFLTAFGVGAEGAAVEHRTATAVAFDDPEASGACNGGVNTQDPDVEALFS
jgi:hypothetical protein